MQFFKIAKLLNEKPQIAVTLHNYIIYSSSIDVPCTMSNLVAPWFATKMKNNRLKYSYNIYSHLHSTSEHTVRVSSGLTHTHTRVMY